LRWERASRVVTAYRLRLDRGLGAGTPFLGLETRSLARDEALPLPAGFSWAADGRSVLYGERVHAAVRIFEITPPERLSG
jgi:hypothetical protein